MATTAWASDECRSHEQGRASGHPEAAGRLGAHPLRRWSARQAVDARAGGARGLHFPLLPRQSPGPVVMEIFFEGVLVSSSCNHTITRASREADISMEIWKGVGIASKPDAAAVAAASGT